MEIFGIILAVVGVGFAIYQIYQGKKTNKLIEDVVKPPPPATIPISDTFDLSPIYTPSSFHGREKEIEELVKLIEDGKRVITLLGMGGIGKSVLACKVAERVKDQFDAVWGFSFKTDVSCSGFLSRLGKHFAGDAASQLPADKLKALVLEGLKAKRCLLVLDNYETVINAYEQADSGTQELRTLLDQKEFKATLLITSRETPTKIIGEHIFELGGLEKQPAIDILREMLAHKQGQFSDAILGEIADKLAEHPLACRLVGGFLAESAIRPQDAVAQVKEILPKARAITNEDNLRSFEDSLGLSLKVLTPEERKLIEAVSVFEGPFTAEAAAFIGEVFEEKVIDGQKGLLIRDDLAVDILNRLCRRSLMQCRPVPRYPQVEIYSIHALIRETIWKGVDQKNCLERLSGLAMFINSDLAKKRDISNTNFLVSVQEMLPDLVRGAERIGEDGGPALSNLGGLLYRQGNFLEANKLFSSRLELAQRSENKMAIAVSIHLIGMIHGRQGDYPAALEKYEQSIKIRKQIVDNLGIAQSLHQIGNIHYLQGNYPVALEKYEQAQAIFNELGAKIEQAAVLHQIGMIQQQQGDYSTALEKYQQSLMIKQEIGNKAGIAATLHQIGNIHYQQGEYPAALEKYEQAQATFKEIGAKLEQAAVLHQIGLIHQNQGDYPAALEKYQQSLKIKQEIGDIAGVGLSLGQIGLLHEKQGDIPKAIELTKQALEIFERIGAKPDIDIAQRALDRMTIES